MIILEGPNTFDAALYEAIVYNDASVAISPVATNRVGLFRERFLAHLATGVICYGVNTGLGALAKTDLTAEEIALLPRQILLGRAVAIGQPLPAQVARGALLIKLIQFLSGVPAVTMNLCQVLADRLNDGLSPFIPSQGHGMAGEIVPLTHLAQTLLAEGRVIGPSGGGIPASDWFAQRGRKPYEPKAKEGIALINGVAVAPAFAWHQLRALGAVLGLANRVAAASIEAIAAPVEPYAPEIAQLRNDPGVSEAAASVRAALAGSQIRRNIRQAPVSFRIVPQVHGALYDALDRLAEATLREMRSVGDNPAFLLGPTAETDRLLHSGNFHAAAHTNAIEAASLALAQVALLSERRLHRILDARYSGLSPQLAARPGLDAGLIAIHKASLAFAAAIRSQAIAPSLQHADSSFGQEDGMTMALPALERLDTFHHLTRRLLACELYASAVALDARGERAGSDIEDLKAAVRTVAPPYKGDRSYGIELEALLELLEILAPPAARAGTGGNGRTAPSVF